MLIDSMCDFIQPGKVLPLLLDVCGHFQHNLFLAINKQTIDISTAFYFPISEI